MLTKVITANTIDGAVDKILDELKEDAASTTSSSAGRNHVIYFDGWDGLGASAVLRAVVQCLTQEAGSSDLASAGLEFSRIFHIDCSKWESRRVMQRMIAKQLKLPDSVMEVFDTQDEEDDSAGLSKGSRAEIPQVAEEINRQILKLSGRFLLILHNGSSEEIDLTNLGFPLFDRYSRSKVLWSFQGRFRAYPRMKVVWALKNTRMTDVFLSVDTSDIGEDVWPDILHLEAEEVTREMKDGSINWPAAAVNCFLYMVKLCRISATTDSDLVTHVSNYCSCDGIIPLQGDVVNNNDVDKLWLSSDALQSEMRLDVDYYYQNPFFPSLAKRHSQLKSMAYWTSPTHGFTLMPDTNIPRGTFQHLDRLCVLKLSVCEFSFTSPPFLCCQSLRFLWLDHCKDIDEDTKEVEETDGVRKEEISQFRQRLWVLDVRYSAFMNKHKAYMMDFISLRELNVIGDDEFDLELCNKLCNIRKLRVTKSQSHAEDFVGKHLSEMDKMEVLDLSENNSMDELNVESCSSLETVIINESSSLRKFSFIQCAKLKNIFLSGSFPTLDRIRITGAAAETLDLSAVTDWDLDEVYVRDCEKLRAILWPSVAAEGRMKIYLFSLVIDTTQKEGTTAAGDLHHTAGRPPSKFRWHISVKDERILRSLEPARDRLDENEAQVEISSPTHPRVNVADHGIKDTSEQRKENATYGDVAASCQKYTSIRQQQRQANEAESDAPGIMCLCPPPPEVPFDGCYLHIEDHLRTKPQPASSITLPAFICDRAKILHVHDSLHTTGILTAPLDLVAWNQLEWCRVEGCPKLECLFSPRGGSREPDTSMFKKLRTAWASDLPNARYIWKWTWAGSRGTWSESETFGNVALLHVDCCPRLINITHCPPVWIAFGKLERLEIMWCSDLIVAFHFSELEPSEWEFDWKHVYLHELPKLQNICNAGSIDIPELETIKIRGCWSLKRLPIVESMNVVECDCEKEWWDRLEWESEEHKMHYKPIHPRYFKKTMLRGSILR